MRAIVWVFVGIILFASVQRFVRLGSGAYPHVVSNSAAIDAWALVIEIGLLAWMAYALCTS